jgi:argininosuccinate lyase
MMIMKLWGGRFEKKTDDMVNDFNSSLPFDKCLYKQDIKGSIAHAKMLGKQGIIKTEYADEIISGLKSILNDIESGKLLIEGDSEDIHSFIEENLVKRIGDTGKMLHTGRSRNDQIALDIKMYVKEEIDTSAELLKNLMATLLDIAINNTETAMPGYTHLQRAQPVSFAHHLMAYFEMLKRDIGRLFDAKKRADEMPLGSGALAGTTYNLDREMVAKELGFKSITQNSLDGVSDRDFVVELLSALSIIMMHLSRFSEEIILWTSSEFAFIELDDAFSTGSSIMPQKKNPDIAELVRGKTGRVYGSLMSILTTLKGLPLAYNKDMQEDKEILFDSVNNVKLCIKVFDGMLKTLSINKDNMKKAAKGGFTNATEVADYLVAKGIPFRNAHEISGKIVLYCIDNEKAIDDLSLSEIKGFSEKFEEDIFEAVSLDTCLKKRSLPGGPSPETVLEAIKKAKKYLMSI